LKLSQLNVLWDMDGTIIDTVNWHFQTWHMTLQTINVNLEQAVFNKYFGRNNRISIPHYLGYEPGEELVNYLINTKEQLFQERATEKTYPFPGVVDWLEYFRKEGIKQAIASSAPMGNIEVLLDAFNLKGYFDALVSGEFIKSKPAPDIFLQAAQDIGADPQYCIVVEDSVSGLLAGKNAGMLTIGVATTNPIDHIKADVLIPNFLVDPAPIFKDILRELIQKEPS